jgi:dihydrofolate reductase
MGKLIVTEWISLDGIADATSMAQWFTPYHSDSRAKSIQETINSCDALLYGRNTYQMLYPYWSAMKNNEMGVAEKLNKARKYVVSKTMTETPWENTEIINSEVNYKIIELKEREAGSILVQGSLTLVKSLMEAGLVDELKLLIHPYIMGTNDGKLFDWAGTGLTLMALQELQNGVIHASYQPQR